MRALRVVGGLAALGAAGLGYAHLETKLFTLRRATIPVLPAGERDLRVLHLSDLHLTPTQRRKIAWVRSLAALEPDLVVDTGDNLAHPDSLGPLLDALEPLLETTPGAFVMGSNDYYAPVPKNPARYLLPDARVAQADPVPLPADRLAGELRVAGWKDLTNRRDVVVADGRRIDLVGVDDPHLDRDRVPDGPPADPDATLRLGVTHAPYRRVLDAMHRDGVDAILAGHTHGGQLRLPLYGALVTNCDLDRRRASGLHGWPGPRPDEMGGNGSTWLHVSAGAGTSPYAPVRFACRPEATLLTFTAR
ncbi:metallophosphoesterase [Isoptericola variabilis]|uniref:Metallophosphoesterase n=1 Tax=Isoptericola variabilis (strain 225) TaxID=743718 RepID=F6FUH7_ISOV2|nr:metallophosphoesterase [Isoptericola variabilis]AEG45404.1 metallophosphoesterase [Isoptericola variabilis 225]TWH30252.1 putative MPP superfamily phosphohydrolase [Isoptericola variabilis J7]